MLHNSTPTCRHVVQWLIRDHKNPSIKRSSEFTIAQTFLCVSCEELNISRTHTAQLSAFFQNRSWSGGWRGGEVVFKSI